VDCRRFSKPKHSVIGTPKTIGQAKITGTIIEKIIGDNPTASLDKVALFWVRKMFWCRYCIRYHRPRRFEYYDGLFSKNNPAQILIANYSRCILMPCLKNAKCFVL
jgi:hypothetical protein